MVSQKLSAQPLTPTFEDADALYMIDASDGLTKQVLGSVLREGLSAPNLFQAASQADLEDQFGTNIIIPDGEAWTILIRNSFTTTKPIQIGLASTLKITEASTELKVTYTGTGALLRNENPANPIASLILGNIDLEGNGINKCFDIVTAFGVFTNNAFVNNFREAGTWDAFFLDIVFTALQGVKYGLIVKGLAAGTFTQFNINQGTSSPPITGVTILSDSTPQLSFSRCFSGDSASEMFYLDQNSAVGSAYNIEKTTGVYANLFRAGVAQAVTSVGDEGGAARFETSGNHNLSVGDFVIMDSDFTETSYQGAFIVATLPTAVQFTLEDVQFVANDSGTLNPPSLGSTDVKVIARDNAKTDDSMFTGDSGLQIFGSDQTITINTIGVPEIITNAAWAFNNLERLSPGIANQGQLVCDDVKTRRYNIRYSGTVEKVPGGSIDVGIVLLKNGVEVSFNAPHTENTGKIQITGDDIIELSETDTIDIAVVNHINTDNIIVSQLGLVVSRA